MDGKRPKSIVWFELLFVGALLVGLYGLRGFWEAARIGVISPLAMGILLLLCFLLPLLWVLLISRRRSSFAKWILILLFALEMLVLLYVLLAPGMAMPWLFLAVTVGEGVGLGLLFTASARAWLADGGLSSDEELEQTFE